MQAGRIPGKLWRDSTELLAGRTGNKARVA
jgi:hypothetical protein